MSRTLQIVAGFLLFGCDVPTSDRGDPGKTEPIDTGASADENDCTEPVVLFFDGDGDGFGDSALAVETCETPAGHVAQGGDCDDIDPQVHPDAEEVCNQRDDNCDNQIDEGVSPFIWYVDIDGDGYGAESEAVEACDAPDGYVSNSDDCDDTNADVHVGAMDDTCDGVDNDCDGSVDEESEWRTWYSDVDGDGYGLDEVVAEACVAPEGFVALAGDCDEERPDINPAATDARCDGLDNDCDGAVDEDAATSEWFMDADGDGFGTASSIMVACARPEGHVPTAGDCDEERADVYPGAPDETCDGVDNDCDTLIDEGAEFVVMYRDDDADGFGTEVSSTLTCGIEDGYVLSAGDCDDTDEMVYPGMSELLDGKDNDCSSVVDDLSLSDADSRFDADPDVIGFGYSMATGHDLTGDGTQDLLIGAHSGSAVALFNGDFIGGDYGPDDAVSTLSSELSTARFGSSIDFVTDYDGDGFADIVVGAPNKDVGPRAGMGEVSIFLGPLTSESVSAAYAHSDFEFESLGTHVIDAGQVTGIETHAVAASFSNPSGLDGVVLFDVGALPSDAKWKLRFLGLGSSDGFGQAMDVADYNGDGFDDMVIGAPSAAVSSTEGPAAGDDVMSVEVMGGATGAVYVFAGPFGDLEMVEDASHSIFGAELNGGFGSALSVAGDWDGDGQPDLLVGAPDVLGGEAYVVSLDGLSTTGTVGSMMLARLTGPAGELGTSVSLAGDANGDGFADALIGAPTHEEASVSVGAAALFLGGLTGTLDGADALVVGTAAGQYTGQSVGFLPGAGSVLDALAIGAWGHDLDGGGSEEIDQGALFIVESAYSDEM